LYEPTGKGGSPGRGGKGTNVRGTSRDKGLRFIWQKLSSRVYGTPAKKKGHPNNRNNTLKREKKRSLKTPAPRREVPSSFSRRKGLARERLGKKEGGDLKWRSNREGAK